MGKEIDMSETNANNLNVNELLEDPELLERASQTMDRLGLCGEEHNRKMIFLAGVGGLLHVPIHLVVHGESSAGKNTLVRVPLQLLPQDAVTEVSGLSTHALEYAGESFEGVLVIHEAEGQQDAEYSIRLAMSEGQVTRLTVNKDSDGRLMGQEVGVEMNCSIITTTTSPSLHRENQTRVYDLHVDESAEQTQRVLEQKALEAAGMRTDAEAEKERALFRQALEELEPAEATVPFAAAIAASFPSDQVRARRDFERALNLVRACALLHQKQRLKDPDETVRAALEDYALTYPLLQTVLEPSMQGLNETALELCKLHNELVGGQGEGWVRRPDLEAEAGTRNIASRNTVHKWCKELVRLGYWQGRRAGRYGAWEHRKLRDPNEEPVTLPTPDELAARCEEAEGPLSVDIDWEASEDPQEDGEKSSQPPNWEGLDPEEKPSDDGRASVPAAWVDGEAGPQKR